MLDIKQIRDNPELVREMLARRGDDYEIQGLLTLDGQQRELETERSQLQARSNQIGKEVGQKIKSGSDPNGPEIAALKEEGNQLKAQLAPRLPS